MNNSASGQYADYTSNSYALPVHQTNPINPQQQYQGESASQSALPSFAAKRTIKPPTSTIPPLAPQLQKPAVAVIEYTPRLDFAQLPEEAVEKYRKMHMGQEMETGDLVDLANSKFQNTPIDERESVAFFIYKCKNSGLDLWFNDIRIGVDSTSFICQA
jgi:hypothetical protein